MSYDYELLCAINNPLSKVLPAYLEGCGSLDNVSLWTHNALLCSDHIWSSYSKRLLCRLKNNESFLVSFKCSKAKVSDYVNFLFWAWSPMIHSKQGTLERATLPKGMTWFEEAFKETEGIDFKWTTRLQFCFLSKYFRGSVCERANKHLTKAQMEMIVWHTTNNHFTAWSVKCTSVTSFLVQRLGHEVFLLFVFSTSPCTENFFT